jgi:hypothetical protein
MSFSKRKTGHKRLAQGWAMEVKDYEATWKIEREYREELVALGFIPQAPKRINIRDLRIDLTEQMAEFFREFGTPNPRELIAWLRSKRSLPAAGEPSSSEAPGNGNGSGSQRGPGICPTGRQPQK